MTRAILIALSLYSVTITKSTELVGPFDDASKGQG